MTATPELNFEVQDGLVSMEALIGCLVGMSFSRLMVGVSGDGVALALRSSGAFRAHHVNEHQ